MFPDGPFGTEVVNGSRGAKFSTVPVPISITAERPTAGGGVSVAIMIYLAWQRRHHLVSVTPCASHASSPSAMRTRETSCCPLSIGAPAEGSHTGTYTSEWASSSAFIDAHFRVEIIAAMFFLSMTSFPSGQSAFSRAPSRLHVAVPSN